MARRGVFSRAVNFCSFPNLSLANYSPAGSHIIPSREIKAERSIYYITTDSLSAVMRAEFSWNSAASRW
jgi:hypothetical protein